MARPLRTALLALGSLTCISAERSWAAGAYAVSSNSSDSAGTRDSSLDTLRGLLAQAREAQKGGDHAGARAWIASAIERALAEIGEREDEAALELLEAMGRFAHDSGDLRGAATARRRVLEARASTRPEDDADLQKARLRLASTVFSLGDLPGARVLQEKALESFAGTLPEDHPDLQWARTNFATTVKALGDLQGALALEKQVLEARSRTLPEDHLEVQAARGNLAATMYDLGDLRSAQALFEKVLESCSRTLPEDHPHLQRVRLNLANTTRKLGDLEGARALEEKALAIYSRTLPDDHPDLLWARANFAATLKALGDTHGARALQEKVLAVRSRNLPEDHPDLQRARRDLAGTLKDLGDLQGARAILERVLEVYSRNLPEDHPDLQGVRQLFASTIASLGDLQGARGLQESVLEVRSRTLAEDHPALQAARQNLAVTLKKLGELEGARGLFEKVLEVHSSNLPEDHPDLLRARGNLATTLDSLGDHQKAMALNEEVLEGFSRIRSGDHLDLLKARQNLAGTLHSLGDLEGARALYETVLESSARALPANHPQVSCHRHNLAGTLAAIPDLEGLAPLAGEFGRGLRALVEDAVLTGSSREAEERVANEAKHISLSLSYSGLLFAQGLGADSASEALTLVETARGAGLVAASLRNALRGDPKARASFDRAAAASAKLTRLAQAGTESDEFAAAARERDEAQRAISAMAASKKDLEIRADPRPELLGKRIAPGEAIVGYWRYTRRTWKQAGENEPADSSPVESLLAHVVRHDGSFTRVELGPIEPIERAVRAWRDAIGAGLERGVDAKVAQTDAARPRGEELRRLVFDPLEEALAGAERVVLALDDVLHLVPIEALPVDGNSEGTEARLSLFDRRRFETRSTLTELLNPIASRPDAETLVSLGGASFNSDPAETSAGDLAAVETTEPARTKAAAILHGGAWERGFAPLTYTGLEAREVAALHDEMFGPSATTFVLEKRRASRAALEELAPKARWLHVATHGWFASESIRSWKDAEPLDELPLLRPSAEEQVKGMSPMLLCGLALAGANLPENELGRVPGLITAEEIAALDLSRCELAVLSACDTNVGERRAGQGVASMQKALQMAGARSVITSLWKVPDEATRELMADFYRRIWVDKLPKAQALREAKRKIREAKDESGLPKYSTRDWAAWVLTGEPN